MQQLRKLPPAMHIVFENGLGVLMAQLADTKDEQIELVLKMARKEYESLPDYVDPVVTEKPSIILPGK